MRIQAKFLSFILLTTVSFAALPEKEARLKLFDDYIKTIERVDGDGLIPRKNRPESWKTTIRKLRRHVADLETEFEFGRILKQVNATYASLHGVLDLAKEYDIEKSKGLVLTAIELKAEEIHEGTRYPKYRISAVNDLAKKITEKDRPKVGDEVLMINNHSVTWWSRSNFIFCKFPQREQCESLLYENLRKEILPWDRSQTLHLKLKRDQRVWGIDVPVQIVKPVLVDQEELKPPLDRYPGFKLVYSGDRIWAFESEKKPDVLVLNLSTFRNDTIAEAEKFYEKVWKHKAPKTKLLVIDVIDNFGGSTPMPWYTLFLDEPFHEEFVRYKKFAEFEREDIRNSLFYEQEGKLKWYKNLKERGGISSVREGQFFSAIPQFCGIEEKDCTRKTDPRKHGFTGKIEVLMNQDCISSCSGFAWQLRTKLGGSRVRFAGFPDAGDTNFARVFVNIYPNKIEVAPRKGGTQPEAPAGAIAQQTVSATMSTDEQGYSVSGQPTKVDTFVPIRFQRTDSSWEAAVFLEAVKDYEEILKKEAKKKK